MCPAILSLLCCTFFPIVAYWILSEKIKQCLKRKFKNHNSYVSACGVCLLVVHLKAGRGKYFKNTEGFHMKKGALVQYMDICGYSVGCEIIMTISGNFINTHPVTTYLRLRLQDFSCICQKYCLMTQMKIDRDALHCT